MSETQIVDLAQRAMYVASITAVPILLVCLVVGLIVSMFETATQIHEQALAFVPKVIAVILLLVVIGGWMVSEIESFTREIFSTISQM
jgi:flagellar biosynthetic protein FliQ